MFFLLDIKNVLESIGSNITVFTKTLPVQEILADLMIYLTQSETYIQDYFPVVEQYDFYRYVIRQELFAIFWSFLKAVKLLMMNTVKQRWYKAIVCSWHFR